MPLPVNFVSLQRLPRRSYDAARLLRELEAQFWLTTDARERAVLADWIVPEYVTYGNPEAAAKILAEVPEQDDPEARARMATLRTLVRAMQGEDFEEDVRLALEMAPQIPECAVALIRHRAGAAYFFARQPRQAEEHSLQALWIADIGGLRRLAARTASVLYGVHYYLTGDLQAARYYAEIATVEAAGAGDDKFRRDYLIAQFDLAVMFGEWERARSMQELVRRERWQDTYFATAAAREGVALLHAHAGDFAAMRGAVDAMLEGASEAADHALGRALRALALAGLGIDDEAAKEARRALGLSKAHGKSELATHTIRRRIGAVVAAFVCVLVGEVHRGSRALETRKKWPSSIGALARAFEGVVRGAAIDADDPNLRSVKGYADVAKSVEAARRRRLESIPEIIRTLTQTELTILRATATGKTNGEIARERGVTRNAVERRLMSAYEKLGVRSRAEAIAKLARI
jgi:DNA-binding CsgD family transcriptional regulator